MSITHTIPFLTKGIVYRNDFTETGSLTSLNLLSPGTFFTNGDIITLTGSTASSPQALEVQTSLSGSPIITGSTNNIMIRYNTGSNSFMQVVFYSGSSGVTIQLPFPSSGLFVVWTGSLSTISSLIGSTLGGYIDKIGIQVVSTTNGSLQSQADFWQFYNENLRFNSITNKGDYSFMRRVIELEAPMREQGIVQTLGSKSPTVDIDGVFINDADFTAQNYRDKIMSIYNEANFQWFQSDFIGAKFVPEDISITELAGVQNYYQFRMKLRQ